jgi:membrane protease YdiL (CAAX protease family)
MKKRPLIWFFVLCFAITWGIGALFLALPDLMARVFGEMSLENPLFVLAVWGPTLSGFIVTAATEGREGVRRLLGRILPGRAGFQWYLFTLFAFPVCSVAINLVAGRPIGLLTLSTNALLSFLLMIVITGPLGEEYGWRGFALPRLLRSFSPLVASLILGFIWGLWHLPTFLFSELPQGGVSLPLFVLGALSLSVIITWMYLHVKGSVLFSVLLHFAVNFSLSLIEVPFLCLTLLQTVLAAVLCVVYGPGLAKRHPPGKPAGGWP